MTEDARALPAGSMVQEYRIERMLGKGGFGITYLATNTAPRAPGAVLVAIKEYFPAAIAVRQALKVTATGAMDERESFRWGLDRFAEEAQILLRLHHPNIVNIQRYFPENGTAYLVMDYVEGETLAAVLARHPTLAPERLEPLLEALADGLEHVHAAGLCHRDVKPSNIYIAANRKPVLLDFGAARQALGDHSQAVTAIATPGYGAIEQYGMEGWLGPWTDIYGLCATAYLAVTGVKPEDARVRMLKDGLLPAINIAGPTWRGHEPLLRRIDAGLAVRPEARPRTIAAWRALGTGPVVAPPPGPWAEVPVTPGGRRQPPPAPRWLLIVVGAVALTLVVLTGISIYNAGNQAGGGDAATADSATSSDAPSDAASPAIPTAAQEAADAAQKVVALATANSQKAVTAAQSATCTGDHTTTTWDHCTGSDKVEDHRYAGDWIDDKPDGCGVSTWDDGKLLRGCAASDGSFTGVLITSDNSTLMLTFVGDEVEGYGSAETADHRRFLGHFHLSKPDGYGVLYNSDGTVDEAGLWKQGKFTGQGQ